MTTERVGALSAIAGTGTLDERCHNLARYFEATLFGPPPAPRPPAPRCTGPRPRRTRRARGVLILNHPRGWWARCADCNRYVASDGTCRYCAPAHPMKETA